VESQGQNGSRLQVTIQPESSACGSPLNANAVITSPGIIADSYKGRLAGSHHYKRHGNEINNSQEWTKRPPCGGVPYQLTQLRICMDNNSELAT